MSNLSDVFLNAKPGLHRYLYRFLSNRFDIEDIVQEAYVKVLEADSKTNIKCHKAYLFRTAKSLVLRQLERCSNHSTVTLDDDAGPEIADSGVTVEDKVESQQNFAVFCEAVRCLPPQCRRAYILRKVYGLSHKEITAHMGISGNTVERHIAKGILRCDEYMDAAGYSRQSAGSSDRRRVGA